MATSVYPRIPPEKRFESRVEYDTNGGCWLWAYGCDRDGYGQFYLVERPNTKAHRVSWMLFRGPVPPGKMVLHRCDIPACVNPDHLFLGSNRENVADMMSKGRHRPTRGEARPMAKLNDIKVREIRRRLARGEHPAQIAVSFDVAASQIYGIRSGKAWRHVSDDVNHTQSPSTGPVASRSTLAGRSQTVGDKAPGRGW